LFVRPWLLVDHSNTDPGVIQNVAFIQTLLNLPVDGTRGYTEQSLTWVSWYLGWPLIAVAFLTAGYLTWRLLRGRDPRWLPVLLIFLCSSVLVLLRPGITPDHPWADRRLVVEVVPCLVLLATGGLAVLARWVGARWRPWLVAVLVLTFVVPEGIALTPVAAQRTQLGELAMSADVCGLLRPTDSVVLIDQQWMPVIRSQCGLPVAQLRNPSPIAVRRITASIRAAGRTPVIAGANPDNATALGLIATGQIELRTQEDQEQLVSRPAGTRELILPFWVVRP
jgi:hypothetical protein